MYLLKVGGMGLMLLGTASAAVILLGSNGYMTVEPVYVFWLLFLLCFLGGIILFCVGSLDSAGFLDSNVWPLFSIASGVLLLVGLISAASIFLSAAGVSSVQDNVSLWALFILCIPSGGFLGYAAHELRKDLKV